MNFSSLIDQLEQSEDPVIYLHDCVISGKIFAATVNNIGRQLMTVRQHRIGLHFTSAFDFSLALFSVLYAGKTPVILPNIQAGFINTIADELDMLMTDVELECSLNIVHLSSFSRLDTIDPSPANEPLSVASVELFTSGSTGLPKRIIKSVNQLETEVKALEGRWGDKINDSLIVSTVSHQHIYGLLFNVLWPLFSGRPLWNSVCHYPEQWLGLSDDFSKITLVSSPAHLKRAYSLVDLSSVQNTVQLVFSSGGPLALKDSTAVYEQLRTPVVEVYGSTETGGIASRIQFEKGHENRLWQTLPGVSIDVDNNTACLKVDSPYTGKSGWYLTSDLVELVSSGKFLLKGRVDRIVKIEEKRVSLAEIEACLTKNNLINQAAAIALVGKRNTIGCIIVLSNEGLEYFSAYGKSALNKALKTFLSDYFELVILPRKWRYVAELPVNEQGKLILENLKPYFSENYKKPVTPLINKMEKQHNEVNLSLTIPPDLDYFDGHFLTKPIVPGVVQIEWAGLLGEEYFLIKGQFNGLEAIKFHEFIYPGDAVSLHLKYMTDRNKLTFSYTSERGKHSSGRVIYQI